jgi:hypothetical protein
LIRAEGSGLTEPGSFAVPAAGDFRSGGRRPTSIVHPEHRRSCCSVPALDGPPCPGAAGAVSALALTLFNAAQPSLGNRKVHPGTVKDVGQQLGSNRCP